MNGMGMKTVIIESPYRGKTEEEKERNIKYAQACLLDSLKRGEAPMASHLLYTQVLDDDNPEERDLGINVGIAWQYVVHSVVFYVDLGMSEGMRRAVDRVSRHRHTGHNIHVEVRSLGKEWSQ